MSQSATYVYCIVRSGAEPDATGAPAGMPGGGPLRALPLADGMWAVIGDVPLPDYGAEEIEGRLSDLDWVSARAMAHEGVVEHFSGLHPAVPMKLFTLFASDERAAADLSDRGEELARLLDRLAGQVEWGLRIRFDPARARQRTTGDGGDASPASGTDFLLRKKREREGARALASGAAEAAEHAFDALARLARATRRRNLAGAPEAGLLLDAAFLVQSGEADAFEKVVGAEAERLAGNACEVTLTGPWPPYNFIGDDLGGEDDR